MTDKIKAILNNPRLYTIYALGKLCKGTDKLDEFYLKLLFKYRLKRKLDFSNIQTYNEKLQWIKVYDKNQQYTKLVDKYAVRSFVKERVGENVLIPLLGCWDRFDEIDFSKLPDEFVLKCTHDSGGIVICHDKSRLNMDDAKKKINRSLKREYYTNTREWPYKNVPHKIIAEQYIGTKHKLPVDYKFFCFNGKIDCVMLCLDRNLGKPKFVFMDLDWNRLNYQYNEPIVEETILKPEGFDIMVSIAEKLCKGFNEVRVDLYSVSGKIYFGELTFFNQSGFDVDITYETDKKWGSMISIPKGVM